MYRRRKVWNPKNKHQQTFIKRHKPVSVNQPSQVENSESLNQYNMYRAFSSKRHRHPQGRSFLVPDVHLRSTRHTKVLQRPAYSLPNVVKANGNIMPKYVYV